MVFTIPFCIVLGPTGLSGATPGVYRDQIVWIVNGVCGPKWPVAVYCANEHQAMTLNDFVNPFIAEHATKDPSAFCLSLHDWEVWPEITAAFDSPGRVFWELALTQLNESPMEYRAAYGFDSFENAFLCQMSRSNVQDKLVACLPNNLTPTRQPTLATPMVPSPTAPVRKGVKKEKEKKDFSNISTISISNDVFLMPEVYQYSEGLVLLNLKQAEDWEDFVEGMILNSIPDAAARLIWDLPPMISTQKKHVGHISVLWKTTFLVENSFSVQMETAQGNPFSTTTRFHSMKIQAHLFQKPQVHAVQLDKCYLIQWKPLVHLKDILYQMHPEVVIWRTAKGRRGPIAELQEENRDD
ncbi:hypothetical protein EDD18DRAFT_1112502 [Armillaria luteobubalina]|uniref:Uncharacterized protein n=1 Tax=Armillaria luteobubalina TaxID=153913 RepID=A0AA39PEN9_9AGAR|nr:hypothetical protein EDD18DRAFT_1112502 [Armillaria luteobubalina]